MGQASSICCDQTSLNKDFRVVTSIRPSQQIHIPDLKHKETIESQFFDHLQSQYQNIIMQAKNTVYFQAQDIKIHENDGEIDAKDIQTKSSFIRNLQNSNTKIFCKYKHSKQNCDLSDYIILFFSDGKYFEGKIEQGAPKNGIFIFNSNCYYVGDIKNFFADGKGKYTNGNNGYCYQGQWRKSLAHGEGKQNYTNGTQFQGNFICGSKFGFGVYKFPDLRIYEGNFYNSYCDGQGTLKCKNGSSYSGEWKLNQMHGKGIFKWINGQKYEGEYVDSLKHGYGVYTFQNGSRYEGQWKYGKKHGKGCIKQGYDEIKQVWNEGIKIQ